MKSLYIVKGDTSPLTRVYVEEYPQLIGMGWKMRVIVKDSLSESAPAILEKDMLLRHDDDRNADYGLAYLAPSETEQLTVGKRYFLIYLVENLAVEIPYRREYQTMLFVSASAV